MSIEEQQERIEILKRYDDLIHHTYRKLNEEGKFLFGYRLPATLEKMQEDKKLFAEKYAEKIMLN